MPAAGPLGKGQIRKSHRTSRRHAAFRQGGLAGREAGPYVEGSLDGVPEMPAQAMG